VGKYKRVGGNGSGGGVGEGDRETSLSKLRGGGGKRKRFLALTPPTTKHTNKTAPTQTSVGRA